MAEPRLPLASIGASGRFASLSPRLLASKGAARPAMRKPNGFSASGNEARADDLGWNDFGDYTQPLPEVLRRIEQLAARLSRPHFAEEAPATATPDTRRAAFTLRLDSERHFRLRMAGVLLEQSAQRIVTEALDKYLSEIPEVSGTPAPCEPVTKRRRKRAQGV